MISRIAVFVGSQRHLRGGCPALKFRDVEDETLDEGRDHVHEA